MRVTTSIMWAFRAYSVVVRQDQRKILQNKMTFSVVKRRKPSPPANKDANLKSVKLPHIKL